MKESRYTEKLKELYASYKEVASNYTRYHRALTIYFYNDEVTCYTFETVGGKRFLIQEFPLYSWFHKYKSMLIQYK